METAQFIFLHLVVPLILLVTILCGEESFFAAWCVVMPITGTVLFFMQGTIPAYTLAFCSLIFIYLKVRSGEVSPRLIQYVKTFLSILLLWLFLLVTSQAGLILSNRHDFRDVNMTDPNDTAVVFRSTLVTQSLYFLACVLIALYFRYFFREKWMKYVYWGGYFLAGYGIYEWVYFLVFHEPGDFLVNRAFGEHTASWSQTISFAGVDLLRIKSTLGEPTFFAGVVIPYLFLALDGNKRILSAMLLFTAVFSTSTACYIALAAVLFIKSFWTRRFRWDYMAALVILGLFLLGMDLFFPETFQGTFGDKFNGENDSGAERLAGLAALEDLLESFTLPNWFFGIGFGYTYLSILTGLLVNTGVIGLLVYLWVFLRPVLCLPATEGCEGLKAGLLGILVLSALSLSELFLPTTWMFLGLAYYRLAAVAGERRTAPLQPAPPDPAAPGTRPLALARKS